MVLDNISLYGLVIWLNNTPLYGYITFCLSIYHYMDIWVASIFWLLWIILLWTLLYTFLCEHMPFYWYIPRSGISKSYDRSLTFWGTAHSFFISFLRNSSPSLKIQGSDSEVRIVSVFFNFRCPSRDLLLRINWKPGMVLLSWPENEIWRWSDLAG